MLLNWITSIKGRVSETIARYISPLAEAAHGDQDPSSSSMSAGNVSPADNDPVRPVSRPTLADMRCVSTQSSESFSTACGMEEEESHCLFEDDEINSTREVEVIDLEDSEDDSIIEVQVIDLEDDESNSTSEVEVIDLGSSGTDTSLPDEEPGDSGVGMSMPPDESNPVLQVAEATTRGSHVLSLASAQVPLRPTDSTREHKTSVTYTARSTDEIVQSLQRHFRTFIIKRQALYRASDDDDNDMQIRREFKLSNDIPKDMIDSKRVPLIPKEHKKREPVFEKF